MSTEDHMAAGMAPFESGVMATVVVRLSNIEIVAVVCQEHDDLRQPGRFQTLFAPADAYVYLPTRLERRRTLRLEGPSVAQRPSDDESEREGVYVYGVVRHDSLDEGQNSFKVPWVFPTEEEAVECVGRIGCEPETTFWVARTRFYPDGL